MLTAMLLRSMADLSLRRTKMKNVLFIGPDHENHRGGIGAVLAVYSAHLRPFKFIPTYSSNRFFLRLMFYMRAVFLLIYTLLTDRAIEIVHIHSSEKGSFLRKSLLLLLCKGWRKKVIIHIHSGNFHHFYEHAGIFRKYISFILQKADAVVCLSNAWKIYFENNFHLQQLTVINNLIDSDTAKRPLDNLDGRVKFLFLGNIRDRKGIFDLMDVLADNQSLFEDRYSLVVAGNGEVQRFQQVISDRHLHGQVRYAGWVNGETKTNLLHDCDVYVLPSYQEGLPVSVLEAMAHGKAVISTNVGGIPEIVKTGYNGWLYEPGDNSALRSIISEALDDRARIKQYGRNSLRLSKDFQPEAVIRSLHELYQTLLQGRHAS